jgi:hypothetical protein
MFERTHWTREASSPSGSGSPASRRTESGPYFAEESPTDSNAFSIRSCRAPAAWIKVIIERSG